MVDPATAASTVEAAGHAAESAGHAAAGGADTGAQILHHILDSNVIEIPFTHASIPLPRIDLFGYDLSITKHVVMMWIAGITLLVLFRLAVRDAGRPVPRGLRNLFEILIDEYDNRWGARGDRATSVRDWERSGV